MKTAAISHHSRGSAAALDWFQDVKNADGQLPRLRHKH